MDGARPRLNAPTLSDRFFSVAGKDLQASESSSCQDEESCFKAALTPLTFNLLTDYQHLSHSEGNLIIFKCRYLMSTNPCRWEEGKGAKTWSSQGA